MYHFNISLYTKTQLGTYLEKNVDRKLENIKQAG